MSAENSHQVDFNQYSIDKTRFWQEFEIPGLRRLDDQTPLPENILMIDDDFISAHMGGPIYIAQSLHPDYPSVETVFAQSLPEEGHEFGNTEPPVAGEVHLLKAGDTDYFYYNNTTRLIMDGVLAGGNTARAWGEIRTIWHPKIVELRTKLRADLGLPPLRHPHQIIVSASGNLAIEDHQLYNLEDVKTFILTTDAGQKTLQSRTLDRNIEIISMGPEPDLNFGLKRLKMAGMSYICAVGGRNIVTQMMNLRHENGPVVRAVHLTTAPERGGVANTPFYTDNRKLEYDIVTKRVGKGKDQDVIYQYLVFK